MLSLNTSANDFCDANFYWFGVFQLELLLSKAQSFALLHLNHFAPPSSIKLFVSDAFDNWMIASVGSFPENPIQLYSTEQLFIPFIYF